MYKYVCKNCGQKASHRITTDPVLNEKGKQIGMSRGLGTFTCACQGKRQRVPIQRAKG